MSAVNHDTSLTDIVRLCRPALWRLRIALVVHWAVRSVSLILTAFALFEILRRLGMSQSDFEHLVVGAALASAVVTVGAVIARWPALDQALRVVDSNLRLHDRLITAYEFATQDSEIVRLQRDELRIRLKSVHMRDAAALRPHKHDIVAVSVAALLALALSSVSSTRQGTPANSVLDQAVIAHATQALERMSHGGILPGSRAKPTTATPLPPPIAKIVHSLESRLSAVSSPRAALRALAPAQSQLLNLARAGALSDASLRALANAFRQGPTSSIAAALSVGDMASTQKQLQALANSIAALPAGQRAALAQTFQQAANAAPASARQALRSAARALSDNNIPLTVQAMKQAAQSIAAAQTSAALVDSAQSTAAKLLAIQHDVASGNAGSPSKARGNTAGIVHAGVPTVAATGNGAGRQAPAAGTASNSGRGMLTPGRAAPGGTAAKQNGGAGGSKPTGSGSGAAGVSGTNAGAVGAAASSRSGAGASGSGASGRGSGGSGQTANRVGNTTTVYLPHVTSTGSSETQVGPLGAPIPIAARAFAPAVARFSAIARQNLGRIALPPTLSQAVKLYFTSLQGG